jgi:phage terminase large subunit GpA-like protein
VRNDALDRRVYALATLYVRPVPWQVLVRAPPSEPPPRRQRRSTAVPRQLPVLHRRQSRQQTVWSAGGYDSGRMIEFSYVSSNRAKFNLTLFYV